MVTKSSLTAIQLSHPFESRLGVISIACKDNHQVVLSYMNMLTKSFS